MLNIIDAHLHLFPEEDTYGKTMAEAVGHLNNVTHLREVYGQYHIKHGVVMGNRSIDPAYHQYPKDLFHYCVGLDNEAVRHGISASRVDIIEENLRQDHCCGIKIYAGYSKYWLSDPMYRPVYELAQTYQKPVAVHMGLTAHPKAHLKYSHPLALDEVASEYRRVKFIMCHFGNPFLQESVAVLAKNPNVSSDLSGLLEGRVDMDDYFQDYRGYTNMLRDWLCYVGCWDRILFGTDFPIVHYGDYIEFISRLVPEQYWDKVFFDNANYIYKLGL